MPQCPNQVNITCLFFEKQQTNLRTISNSSTVDKKSAISLCLLPIIDPSTGHVKQPKKARNAPIISALFSQTNHGGLGRDLPGGYPNREG